MNQNHQFNNPVDNDRDKLLHRIQELEKGCQRAEDALAELEGENRLLGESSPFGIFLIDTQGRMLRANQKMLDMLAWPARRDITQSNIFEHAPLVDSGVADAFRRCLEKRIRVTSDHLYPKDRDGCLHLRYHISPVIDDNERFSGVIAFVEDVSELKLAEEAIVASEKRYRLLFESAPVAMIERDASALKQRLEQLRVDGVSDLRSYFDEYPQELVQCIALMKTVDCNSAFMDLMEAQTWEEIDSGLRMTNSPDYLMQLAREIILMVADGNISNEREDTLVTIRGTKKSILAKSLPLTGHEDTLARIVVAMMDITKRKEAEEALRANEQRFREQAMRDDLTGLYNRRYLFQSLTELVEHAKVNGWVVSVIFMDLDYFKHVVDTYGHLNGSRTITEVGQAIRETIERPAYAVAYAGDEFVVVLPGHGPDQALSQAREIRNRIRNRVFLRDQGLEVRIRSSFGIATFPHHAETMTDLLAAADDALFAAKGAGKDKIKSAG